MNRRNQTAFVLSGGGSLGAVQVGMLLALAEAGVVPDLIIGASVGAVNAAWLAGRPGLDGTADLAAIWRSVRRDDIFPLHPLGGLLGFAGRRNHLVDPSRFRRLLAGHLGYQDLENAAVPVRVVATDVATGAEIVLVRGNTVHAVAASTAIPGVFPPVRVDGRDLMDGGVSNNTPIAHALDEGATTVYVLPTGYACALDRPPRSALGMALHAVSLLVQQRLAADVARRWEDVDLRIVPPLCPLAVSPVDFGHTGRLIDEAYEATAHWLGAGALAAGPARFPPGAVPGSRRRRPRGRGCRRWRWPTDTWRCG